MIQGGIMKKLIFILALMMMAFTMPLFSATLTEGFNDAGWGGSYGNYTVNDWTLSNVYRETSYKYEGAAAVRFATSSANPRSIVSPEKSGGVGTISFWHRIWSSSDGSVSFSVYVSTDGTTWGTAVGTGTMTSDTYSQYSVSPMNSNAKYVKIEIATAAKRALIDLVEITDAAATPTITVSPSSLTDFGYVYGSTTSTEQTFTVSGSNLTNNISIAATTNYEISKSSGSGYTTPLTYTPAQVATAQTVYVRLKTGLAIGDYNSETITATSSGATNQTVTCSGSVTTPPAPSAPTATAATSVTANSFTANWDAVSGATGYKLDVYTKSSGGNASDLFISEYIEGSSNNKGIEIYNGTGATIDLSTYSLKQYNNGASTPTYTLALSGNLTNGSVYRIVHSSQTIFGTNYDLSTTASVIGFNGNDAMAIFNGTTLVDVVGPIGDATDWGKDVTLVRKAAATVPANTYTSSDWDSYGTDIVTNWGAHTFSGGSTKTFVSGYEDLDVSNVTTYPVTGLAQGTTYYYVVRAYNAYGTSGDSNEITVNTTSTSNIPPSITNIVLSPSTGITSSTTVSVSATITDSDGTVEGAELYWGTTSGNLSNHIAMSNTTGTTWVTVTSIPAQANNTTVYYAVYAMDDGLEETTSPEASYTVTDPVNTPPSITNIVHTPSTGITSSDTVSISATITDSEGTVFGAELHWGTTSGVLTNNIDMSKTIGDTWVTVTPIPAQADNTIVYYEVYALDDELDESTSPEQSYTVTGPLPSVTEIIMPQYMQGVSTTNNQRIPTAARLKLENLSPSATYRYAVQFVESTDAATSDGAGIGLFVAPDGTFTRSTTLGLATAGHYGEFTTNASGEFEGWFMGEPSGNARFTPGNELYFRIRLNDGNNGTAVVSRLTTSLAMKVINFGTAEDVNQGTFLRGISQSPAKNFAFVYDNEAGTGRPISGTVIEDDGLSLSEVSQILPAYKTYVDNIAGAWGLIIPNSTGTKGFTGIKRVESRKLSDGEIYAEATDSDGVWPSGTNTVNPTGGDGSGHLVMGEFDATLPVELSSFTVALNSSNQAVLTWVTQTETGVNGFYIYRSNEGVLADALLISSLIPATNSSQQQVYIYRDKELNGAGTYYYWLQVSDLNGSESYHGPVTLVYEDGNDQQTPVIPKVTELKKIFPNPFNPSATISYSLVDAAPVSIKIYNSRGQMVRSFEEGLQNAGSYNLIWNGEDNSGRSLPTGVYYIRMQAGQQSFNKKAVLMK
jgi:hypothetical protein